MAGAAALAAGAIGSAQDAPRTQSLWIQTEEGHAVPALTAPAGARFLVRRLDGDGGAARTPYVAEIALPGRLLRPVLRLGAHDADGIARGSFDALFVVEPGETLQLTDYGAGRERAGRWVVTGEWLPAATGIETRFTDLAADDLHEPVLRVEQAGGLRLASYGACRAGGEEFGVVVFRIVDDFGKLRLQLPPIQIHRGLQTRECGLLLPHGWTVEAGTQGVPVPKQPEEQPAPRPTVWCTVERS